MLLQNALFLFIPDIYIRGWTLIKLEFQGHIHQPWPRPITNTLYLKSQVWNNVWAIKIYDELHQGGL